MNPEALPAATGDLLASAAAAADQESMWPAASWNALCAAGALRWAIPTSYGGLGLDTRRYLELQIHLAQCCLTTAFILSQQDAAVRRLLAWPGPIAEELLPRVARGECRLTVGIAQLTTSRQHVAPTLRATLADGFVHLDGTLPWVTAASQADFLIAGAVAEDGQQVLVALPTTASGLTVRQPYDLAALQGSLTAEVHCAHVKLERRLLLAGPGTDLLRGASGPGGLESTALALGLCRAAVGFLHSQAANRAEWLALATRAAEETESLAGELFVAAELPVADRPADLRGRANHLVLRLTQTALAAAKGAGFLRSHPAQRWARQALFFLVWSCPRPALDATLQLLHVGAPAGEEPSDVP